MEYINKLEKYLEKKYDAEVIISEDYAGSSPDLELSEWYTADDYNVFVLTNDANQLVWEYDVYYYEPSFDTIMERIEETINDVKFDVKILISDLETFLPEGEVRDYLEKTTWEQEV